jgi:hypothetical protein
MVELELELKQTQIPQKPEVCFPPTQPGKERLKLKAGQKKKEKGGSEGGSKPKQPRARAKAAK